MTYTALVPPPATNNSLPSGVIVISTGRESRPKEMVSITVCVDTSTTDTVPPISAVTYGAAAVGREHQVARAIAYQEEAVDSFVFHVDDGDGVARLGRGVHPAAVRADADAFRFDTDPPLADHFTRRNVVARCERRVFVGRPNLRCRPG